MMNKIFILITALTLGFGNTEGHPFWVVTDKPDLSRAARSVVDENGVVLYHENLASGLNGFWVEAKDLQVGDVFLGANGELSTLTGIVRVEQEGGIAVFNITVEGNHNYFILAKEYEYGQTCILVHNVRECNGGYGGVHGGPDHNKAIDDYIKENLAGRDGIANIRKNQQQVGANMQGGWSNRPDIQYDYKNSDGTWVHVNIEFDHNSCSSLAHEARILRNDPDCVVKLFLL